MVSDGKLLLELQPAENGWYAVTSPMDPQLITQGKSIEECFAMAYDAQKTLLEARAKYQDQISKLMAADSAN